MNTPEIQVSLKEENNKTPEEAINTLILKRDATIKEVEKFQEEWCIKINEFTWNHQESVCSFIDNAFPELESLQLLKN